MRCIILSSAQYFSVLPHKRHKFVEKLLTIMCVFIFPANFETFPIRRRNEREIIKNINWSSCKVGVLFATF
jgi:hypothetical protein